MFPVIQIGPFSVQSSGLILLAGLWLALTLVERIAEHVGADADEMSNLTFYALIGALLGSRLSYALQFPNAFTDHPASLISLNPGLLDPLGGMLVAALVAFIYGQRANLEVWPTLDALAPGAALIGIAISFSQLANGEAYGLASSVPWAIELWGIERHPTQIYAILAGIAILILLIKGIVPKRLFQGHVLLAYLAMAAFSRLVIDGFRGDAQQLIFGMRESQLIAWVLLAGVLYFYLQQSNAAHKEP